MNILWDFDGTLFDTYPSYTSMFKEMLGDAVSEQEIYSQLKISITHAVKHYELSDEQLKQLRGKEHTVDPADTPPFPGVEPILKLADVNVIMTHKPRKEVARILQHYGWEGYFSEMVAGDDGYPRKPDPASYQYLHDKYKLDLAIGDRELDIIPARIIGIQTCLFQNETPGADFYLTSYDAFFKQDIPGALSRRGR